jgi:N-acetylmuramoyl-L-alanine amidase
MDIGAKEIHGWHLQRGIYSERGLTGYHYVIRRNGIVELGRDLQAIGAHALGYNARSVGICLVGGARKIVPGEKPEWGDMMISEDNFVAVQHESLARILVSLLTIWPSALIAGHRSFDSHKTCPAFDVGAWQTKTMGFDDTLRVKEALSLDEHRIPETVSEVNPKES